MRERDLNVDLLRVFACLCVIVIHVSGPLLQKTEINTFYFLSNLILDSFSRVAVPLFVMISGRYLLKADFTFNVNKYNKSIIRILRPLLFWSIFYIILYIGYKIYRKESIDYHMILDNFIQGKPYFHLWYLFMIIGIYIIAPFINHMINILTKVQLKIAVWGLISFSFLHQLYNIIYNVEDFWGIWFIDYIGYFILGYLYKDKFYKNYNLFLLGYIISSLLIFLSSYFTYSLYKQLPFFNYNSIFVISSSFCIYSYFVNLKIQKSFLIKYSETTFGIYLIHPLFILFTLKYLEKSIIIELLGILFIFLISHYIIKILSINSNLKNYLV